MNGPFHGAPEVGKPLARKIVRAIHPCDRLLDVGAGIRPYDHFDARVHLCIEPHWEYVNVLIERGYPVIQSPAVDVLPSLRNFETILFIDVIEHMVKEDGLLCVNLASSLATKQVVVFTPLGFIAQEPTREGFDPWGYSGWEWQTHRSGWTPDDFKGWKIEVDETFHRDHGAFFAVLNK